MSLLSLGYLSETAASLVDQKLGLNVVPRTAIVALAAPTFNYGRIDRTVTSTKEQIARNYPDLGRHFKRIGLPPKRGSFQLFVHGYKDAKYFLDQWEQYPEQAPPKPSQKEFQLQFENMVVLDYIIRNTDRGNDNWLVCYTPATLASEEGAERRRRVSSSSSGELKRSDSLKQLKEELGNEPAKFMEDGKLIDIQEPGTGITERGSSAFAFAFICFYVLFLILLFFETLNRARSESANDNWEDVNMPHVKVAAIDNGLAFPFKHPDQWRAYPYQWAKLPMAQLPFSEEIVQKILPLIDNTDFVRQLGNDLRNVFKTDKGFDKKTFVKQLSVIYGQMFNLREALRTRKTPLQLVQMTPQYMIEIKKKRKKQPSSNSSESTNVNKVGASTAPTAGGAVRQQKLTTKLDAGGHNEKRKDVVIAGGAGLTTTTTTKQQIIVDVETTSSVYEDGDASMAMTESQLASASTASYSRLVGPAPAQTPNELDDPKAWPNVFQQKVHTRFPLFSCCESANDNWEDVNLPHVKVAAIDNGLAFPFKHPDQWRAYPYQWAKLPMAQHPFSEEIVQKILPLIDNTDFVRQLGNDLRNVFKTDKGFDKKTFVKQLSVIYGQMFNLREALRTRKTPLQLVQMTPQYMIEIKKKRKTQPSSNSSESTNVKKVGASTAPTAGGAVRQQKLTTNNEKRKDVVIAGGAGLTTTTTTTKQQIIVDVETTSSVYEDGDASMAMTESQLASASTASYSRLVGPAPAQTPNELDDPKAWPNVFQQKVHTRFPLFSCW
uniref:Phosphatidylinositol 4-kinase type 2 n=1 Tax=Globodera pallida TaxID=36090 RepID=A0A183BLK2_GLOPA